MARIEPTGIACPFGPFQPAWGGILWGRGICHRGQAETEVNMEAYKMGAIEEKFAGLVWENEPIPSGKLVKLAAEHLEWKKSTTDRKSVV